MWPCKRAPTGAAPCRGSRPMHNLPDAPGMPRRRPDPPSPSRGDPPGVAPGGDPASNGGVGGKNSSLLPSIISRATNRDWMSYRSWSPLLTSIQRVEIGHFPMTVDDSRMDTISQMPFSSKYNNVSVVRLTLTLTSLHVHHWSHVFRPVLHLALVGSLIKGLSFDAFVSHPFQDLDTELKRVLHRAIRHTVNQG